MSAQHYAITDAAGALLRQVCTDEAEPQIALAEGEQLHAVPGPAPLPQGQGWVVRWVGGAWQQHDARTLEQARAQRWAEIKAQRDARIAAAGATAVGVFDTSPASVLNITSVAAMLLANPALPEVAFTLADNTRPTMARADFLAAATQVGAAVQALHDQAHQLRTQIDGAATVAAVMAVDWPQD